MTYRRDLLSRHVRTCAALTAPRFVAASRSLRRMRWRGSRRSIRKLNAYARTTPERALKAAAAARRAHPERREPGRLLLGVPDRREVTISTSRVVTTTKRHESRIASGISDTGRHQVVRCLKEVVQGRSAKLRQTEGPSPNTTRPTGFRSTTWMRPTGPVRHRAGLGVAPVASFDIRAAGKR